MRSTRAEEVSIQAMSPDWVLLGKSLERGEGRWHLVVDVAVLGKRITSCHGGTIVGDSIDGSHIGDSTMVTALA
jgi:hypothetical protein